MVEIRQAQISDAPFLVPLCSELGYPTTEEEIHERLARISSDPNRGVFVARDSSQTAIGWVEVQARHCLIAGDFAEVEGLVVDQRFRSSGVGRALMIEAERWVAARGLGQVRLRSRIHRDRAHRFYEDIGYECTKVQKVFDKSLGSNSLG